MLITSKVSFSYKFLASLFLISMFTSNGNAAVVVPVDWLNNTSSNITDLSFDNVYEYYSNHSAADPNVGSYRIRLDYGNNGFVSGTVTLPSFDAWQLNFYVINDDGANDDTASEYVKLYLDGSLFSTIYNTTPNEATLISYDFTGDSFTYYFDFYSPVLLASRHLVVETGTVSVIPVPAAVWLFGTGLLGLVGVARRKKY